MNITGKIKYLIINVGQISPKKSNSTLMKLYYENEAVEKNKNYPEPEEGSQLKCILQKSWTALKSEFIV